MNTFWLKLAGIAVLVLVVIVLVIVILPSGETQPKPRPKTFYDMADRDSNKFLKKPQNVEAPDQNQGQVEPKPPEPPSVSKPTGTAQKTTPTVKKVTLYFSELSEIDKIEAQRFLNVAVPGRSIGRLPMTGFILMVQNCRRIIQRWPDSWYAYRSRQMLADIPVRFRARYHITEEEMDLSRYSKPREGTKPLVVENTD